MGSTDAMLAMEHPSSTISASPLVDDRVLLRFCQAVQRYADTVGSHDEVAAKLRELRARLDNLRGLASLCRLAIVGHPNSVDRVIDELYCLSVDFPSDSLEEPDDEVDMKDDELDDRVYLAAAVDLLAGAAFVSKDDPRQRDRLITGVVHAIEDAIAFPVAFSAEAATYLGEGEHGQSIVHARIVIANATQRLLDSDQKCAPPVPAKIRSRLGCLARKWTCNDPVTEFFRAIAGPKLIHVVHWENPEIARPHVARVGDRVILLVHEREEQHGVGRTGAYCHKLHDLRVMFCPHQPAPVVRMVDDGLEVLVPEGARTGPIAVVRKAPDFTGVQRLLSEYADEFQAEWLFSIFSFVRMDMWAFPVAFGPPLIEIFRYAKAKDPPAGHGPDPSASVQGMSSAVIGPR
jgi:hypothetical protein